MSVSSAKLVWADLSDRIKAAVSDAVSNLSFEFQRNYDFVVSGYLVKIYGFV